MARDCLDCEFVIKGSRSHPCNICNLVRGAAPSRWRKREFNPATKADSNGEGWVPDSAEPSNPKKAFGMTKPPLHLIPDTAAVHMAMSFKDGATKYGPFNWRTSGVDATTYVAAARRHLALWFDGQELTSDSGVHNLGAVMACCAILLDAQAVGNLIDDRPPTANLEKIMDAWTVGNGLPSQSKEQA